MKSQPKIIEFEWDKGNITKNKKHKVENSEAEEVFRDKESIILDDRKHTTVKEERYIILGLSRKKRKLSVIFTERKSKIRIISCRDMSMYERRLYEEKGTKDDSKI